MIYILIYILIALICRELFMKDALEMAWKDNGEQWAIDHAYTILITDIIVTMAWPILLVLIIGNTLFNHTFK